MVFCFVLLISIDTFMNCYQKATISLEGNRSCLLISHPTRNCNGVTYFESEQWAGFCGRKRCQLDYSRKEPLHALAIGSCS